MTKLSETNGYHRTDNATATAADIATGKTAYIAGGQVTGTLSLYTPAMMEFDGSTGYYSTAAVNFDFSSGVTIVARFQWNGGTITSAGGFNRIICVFNATSGIKAQLTITNDQTGDSRAGCLAFTSQDNTPTTICALYSNTVVSDGGLYTAFVSYNPSAGTAIMQVNGVNDINTGATGHTITTGTIANTSAAAGFGARIIPDRYFDGDIGFLGIRGAALTNPADFFNADGSPRQLDETTWTEWGAQPLFWNEHGDMENNLGSATAPSKNGTIVVGKGGN